MNTLTIISNRYFNQKSGQYEEAEGFLDVLRKPNLWTSFECDDIMGPLQFYFESLPHNARIYYEYVSQDRDVTPTDAEGVERLRKLEGNFFVIAYPGGITAAIVIAIVAVVAVTPAHAGLTLAGFDISTRI